MEPVHHAIDIDRLDAWMRLWGEPGIRMDGGGVPALLVVGSAPGSAYQAALDRRVDEPGSAYRSVVLTTAIEMTGIDTNRLVAAFNRGSGSVVASLEPAHAVGRWERICEPKADLFRREW